MISEKGIGLPEWIFIVLFSPLIIAGIMFALVMGLVDK